MLFLFENALTPYIYSVFYTLICRAQSSQSLQLLSCEQTRHTDPPHPRPDLSSFAPMSNHAPNGIRAHTDRNTITPPGFRILISQT